MRRLKPLFWALLVGAMLLVGAIVVGLPFAGCGKRVSVPPVPRRPHATATQAAAPMLAALPADTAARKEPDPRVFHRSLTEPEFLDPGMCSESEGGAVLGDTFEGLFVYGPDHRDVRPGAATSIDVTPDGKTYTFHLRPGALWSDGVPVTADDFVWSWKRVMDPAFGSRNADFLSPIEGALAYAHSGKASEKARAALRDAVGVNAPDTQTLVVRLTAPTPYFKATTAFYTLLPVPRHVVEGASPGPGGKPWTRPGEMVSNGPWTLAEWRSRERIVLTRNDRYWDAAHTPFDRVVYHIAETDEPLHNMYLAGELDYLQGHVPTSVLPTYLKEKRPDLVVSPHLAVYYYIFNVERPPFNDVRVRKALNLAIDKRELGAFVLKGGQEAATSIVPPTIREIGYTPAQGPQADPEAARVLLADAGYPGGRGFPHIEIAYNTNEGNQRVAEFVQQQWKRALGVDASLENMEWKVLLKRQAAHDYGIIRSAWIGDYVDPLTFLDLWESRNPNNQSGYARPEYDRLIDRVRHEPDVTQRFGLLRQAEEMFLTDMPGLPLYFYVKFDLVQPWVKGFSPHLQDVHPSRYFRVER